MSGRGIAVTAAARPRSISGLNQPGIGKAIVITTNQDWEFDIEHPDKPGWYATLHCWDSVEGIFDRATEWLGEKWANALPIIAWAGPFSDESTAQKWAENNNPED